MDRAIHVVAFDGYADWEPALALAELRRSAGAQVVTVGFSREPITSMGGLRVQIDRALDDVRSDEVGLLILPGGDCWEQGRYPVAAIERLLHASTTLVCPSLRFAALRWRSHVPACSPIAGTRATTPAGSPPWLRATQAASVT